jgi:Transglutaminase-like superfamily/NPCBM/NEW2 domain
MVLMNAREYTIVGLTVIALMMMTTFGFCQQQVENEIHDETLPGIMTPEEQEQVMQFKKNIEWYRNMSVSNNDVEYATSNARSSDPRQPGIKKVVLGANSALYLTNPVYGDARLINEATNVGSSNMNYMRFYNLCPLEMPRQEILNIEYFPKASHEFLTDDRGQLLSYHNITGVTPGTYVKTGWRARVVTWVSDYEIDPADVGPLSEVDADMKAEYVDKYESIYQKDHTIVVDAMNEAIGTETHPLHMAHKIFIWMQQHFVHIGEGGWDNAPVVIARRNGSCSEWMYAYVAMCRAAGIPARWSGSVVRRGDEEGPGPYIDDPHHRWADFYLPRIGWVECNVDSNGLQNWLFLPNRYLITSKSSGSSNYMGVRYESYYRRSGSSSQNKRFSEWYSHRNFNYLLMPELSPEYWALMGFVKINWSIVGGYEEAGKEYTMELCRMGTTIWEATGLSPTAGHVTIPLNDIGAYGPHYFARLYRSDCPALSGSLFPMEFSFDGDMDDLDDRWENKHWGNLLMNGEGDPDGDGANNLCEYYGMTNPRRPDVYVSDMQELSAQVGLGSLGHNTYGYMGGNDKVMSNNHVWDKALGAHASSVVEYLVPEGVRFFQSMYALDDFGYGEACFQVYVNDQLAYGGGNTKKSSGYNNKPIIVSVPVSGGDTLKLVTDPIFDAGNDNTCWLSPAFVTLPDDPRNWMLFQLAESWQQETPVGSSLDFQQNGSIDEKDLLYLIKHWAD